MRKYCHSRAVAAFIHLRETLAILAISRVLPATAVASNTPFGEWDKTFTDPRLCAAVADGLTSKCTLIETGADSYRLATTEAEHKAQR